MATEHRFKDEWLVRVASGLAGVTPEKIAAWREEKRPVLASELVSSGAATLDQLGEALKTAHGFGWVAPNQEAADKLAVSLVPEKVCRRHGLVPLRVRGEAIEVAMSCPIDIDALSDVRAVSGRTPTPLYCLPDRVSALIDQLYRPEVVVYDLIERLDEKGKVEIVEGGGNEEGDASTDDTVRTPVIRLVNAILSRAARMNASDIHIEHDENSSHVRLRIDGLLRNVMVLPRHIAVGPVVSRIKIMSELDISEHRRPQDGRAKILVDGAELGLRVSVLPTNFGEKVVMRILDSSGLKVNMTQLGFEPEAMAVFKKAMEAPYGVNLVTGPTGSGKSTTLYSALANLNTPDTNIMTAEDPVEYQLKGINQVQIHNQVGLTFAAALRSFLRQDPDVIMVGEIRDQETATIAINAALTGHLVFSTLHTNDTAQTITRLGMMGVEPFLISAAMLMVEAQRLVRGICPKCKEPYEVEKDWMLKLGVPEAQLQTTEKGKIVLHKGKGCENCASTGYRGRQGLYEVMEMTDAIRQMVLDRASSREIKNQSMKQGMLTLRMCAIRKVLAGTTTVEEMMRTTTSDVDT